MTYLKQLEAHKSAREQYEKDLQRLKELVLKINDLHSAHDGEFLTELEAFIVSFKIKKEIAK